MLAGKFWKGRPLVRNATLLLLVGMTAGTFLFSTGADAKQTPVRIAGVNNSVRVAGVNNAGNCYAYAKTLKVGAAKANPRDRIRQRIYETDDACNPKQNMTLLQSSDGKSVLRRKGTAWLPK